MRLSALNIPANSVSRISSLWLVVFILLPAFSFAYRPNPGSPFPLIQPQALIKDGNVFLKPVVIGDTLQRSLNFFWEASAGNPAIVTIHQHGDGTASAGIPEVKGEYFFTLNVTSGSESEKLETYVIRDEKGLTAFDIQSMKASWINNAIIYQVTPYIFVKGAKYPDIEAKLPELVDLGINTVYLQPVFKSERGGQGYDITDYFSLRDDLGTEEELKSLITKAKSLHLRILFDLVPNHTSIYHPYAKDKISNGVNSPYYDFYQQSFDGAMYASHYHQHPQGFVYYFWKDLVNLNFNNEKVQRLILDACKYWVRKFDIDGYRFDAVWGVNARAPLFGKRLQLELKSLKPDLLLLAEDKASDGRVYRQGFDAAYDWTNDTGWVSQWSWQYAYDSLHQQTIFNHPSVATRRTLLRNALFSDGDSIGLRLRYLENNDHHRFISNHSLQVTNMAATLLFGLSGLPMLYNGQEIGFKDFPYRSRPIFQKDKTIRSVNPQVFDFYKNLVRIRKENEALASGTLTEIQLRGGKGAVAFLRSNGKQDIVVIINMAANSAKVHLKLAGLIKGLGKRPGFRDLFLNHMVFAKTRKSETLSVTVDAYTTKLLLLDKNEIATDRK